ncbi:MAG: hypothetical protein PHN89_05390 [Candidatus Pacebacteria bacterium]|nr:hypothetical protein [Candidatus Paceibacterota bacterium]
MLQPKNSDLEDKKEETAEEYEAPESAEFSPEEKYIRDVTDNGIMPGGAYHY